MYTISFFAPFHQEIVFPGRTLANWRPKPEPRPRMPEMPVNNGALHPANTSKDPDIQGQTESAGQAPAQAGHPSSGAHHPQRIGVLDLMHTPEGRRAQLKERPSPSPAPNAALY